MKKRKSGWGEVTMATAMSETVNWGLGYSRLEQTNAFGASCCSTLHQSRGVAVDTASVLEAMGS